LIIRTPRVRRDLINHFAYLLEQNPDAAERFLKVAEETFKELAKMPEMGHLWFSPHERLQGDRKKAGEIAEALQN
jgi:toxin ParE1/3/4